MVVWQPYFNADCPLLMFSSRHILRDIDPYVCLFEECSQPNEQYQSFDDWMMHMKWQHTLVWSCPAPIHSSLTFDTAEECKDYFGAEHGEYISDSQLTTLVKKSVRPSADPLDALTRSKCDGDRVETVCPLCPFSVHKDVATEIEEGKGSRRCETILQHI